VYKRLLLTTDGSSDSYAAVEHAAALARAHQASVVVLEVIETPDEVYRRASAAGWVPSGTGFLTPENVDSLVSAERSAARHHTESIQAALERAGVDAVECMVTAGSPGAEIVRVADEAQCDTILIATHGRTGLARLLLGSVADYVARHARTAVILVPTRSTAAGRPPTG
jgi:nucleotide-binding universal stress UspA family protein